MKKQKKVVLASILAASTLFTLTAVASAQNTAAYAELRDICILQMNSDIQNTNSNYESTTTKTITDENGNIFINHKSDISADNGYIHSFYATKNGELTNEYGYASMSNYIQGDGVYIYYGKSQNAEYIPDTGQFDIKPYDEIEPQVENEALTMFTTVLVDTVVPNDVKSLVKKTSDGTFTLDLSKNQMPELAALALNAMDEEHDTMQAEIEKGNMTASPTLPSVFDLNSPAIESVSFKLKGNSANIELCNIVATISGTNDSGNAVTNTVEVDAVRKTESVANVVKANLNGYTIVDFSQEFTTAKFIKDGTIYEVTADEVKQYFGEETPDIGSALGYVFHKGDANIAPNYTGSAYYYFDTIIYTDLDGVEHTLYPYDITTDSYSEGSVPIAITTG